MEGVVLRQVLLDLTGDAGKTSYSSALVPETDEFHSIVSIAEKLNEQVTLMEDETKENHSEELTSSTSPETSQNRPDLPKAVPENAPSFSSLLPKALSAMLHPALPPKLEQLQTELRDLRDQFDQMKSQHNKEIKQLMSELDEEKRIRLTLQMEIQRMKKHMSK